MICCVVEDQNEGSVLNGVDQIKEEKEEDEELPVAKKSRNEGRSQRANKAKPVAKEETEGDAQYACANTNISSNVIGSVRDLPKSFVICNQCTGYCTQ